MFKTLTASFTFFKAEPNLGYVYSKYPIRQNCCSNLELISFTTGYGNTHNNSIHINSSSVDTQIKG